MIHRVIYLFLFAFDFFFYYYFFHLYIFNYFFFYERHVLRIGIFLLNTKSFSIFSTIKQAASSLLWFPIILWFLHIFCKSIPKLWTSSVLMNMEIEAEIWICLYIFMIQKATKRWQIVDGVQQSLQIYENSESNSVNCLSYKL